ncbi:MAG: hypothetical protein DMD92_12380 [Candidatus Rokuibacteriota bacterium]|nr:MAG: hypothetical protein DMD92_12380 [Candidatus Rokubacteria bacterium]
MLKDLTRLPLVLSSCRIVDGPPVGAAHATKRLTPATPIPETGVVQPDGIVAGTAATPVAVRWRILEPAEVW